MLQGCPNGSRQRGVPVTPDAIAGAVTAMVAAGVTEVHVHPKALSGEDTLDPNVVAEVVLAVRRVAPGIAVGVTTGAWAEPDPKVRRALVGAWHQHAAPDYASVNWHEPGAREVAMTLLHAGIGVEAGVYSGTNGAEMLAVSGLAGDMHRVLAEIVDTHRERVRQAARRHYELVLPLAVATGRPVLLHREEQGAWPVLELAAKLGADTRIGLEDVLFDANGRPADNAALVRTALDFQGC